MQEPRYPKWHNQKKRTVERQEKAGEADDAAAVGVWRKFKASFSKEFMSSFAKLLLFALAGLLAVAINFFDFADIKQFFFGKQDVMEVDYFSFSGQLLTTDRMPLPGVNVVIVSHDVASGETDTNGYYDMRVKLPADTETVELRFVDKNHNEVYHEAVAARKNPIEDGEVEQHFVPNDPE